MRFDNLPSMLEVQDRGHTSPCWVWQGAIDSNGYGRGWCPPMETRLAHRLVWEYMNGGEPPPELDHLCRVKECCNPDHLEAVPHRENVLRGVGPSAENAAKTHCAHGHEYTVENTYRPPGAMNKRKCRTCLEHRNERRKAERLAQAA